MEAGGQNRGQGPGETSGNPWSNLHIWTKVYFTRNGKIIGKKDVVLPRGGFYPTVGMMSSQVEIGSFSKFLLT